jgi:polysaccharide biosynthesis transport protein
MSSIVDEVPRQGRPLPVMPGAFASLGDGTARLEPLAVPFGSLISVLRRHIWIILLTFAFGVGGTAVMVKGMAKRYTAEASIIVEPQRTQVSDLQAISADGQDVPSLVRTQIDILQSPALATGVVRALHLWQNPEFEARPGGVVFRTTQVLERLGLLPTPAPQGAVVEDAISAAAAALSSKISFANDARSSVLSIAVTTRSAELSARIANEVARQYLDFKVEEKFTAMQRAHDWLQEQVATLADQVRADDQAVEKYRLQHGLDEVSSDLNGAPLAATVNREQLDAISGQLAEVSREETLKEGELAEAKLALAGKVSPNALPEVLVSPVVAELLAQTAVTAGREAQLAASEGEGNPELVSVRAQLKRLQGRAAQEVTNVANSLAIEVNSARQQEAALMSRMAALRGAVSAENSAEVGLQSLQTRARATRNIYESFLTRSAQLANVAGIQEPDASLVSGAEAPLGPSAPKGARLLVIAAALSLVVGVGLACIIERLRGGFSIPEQVEAALGLPMIALVPKVSLRALRRSNRHRAAIAFTASLNRLRGQMRVLGEDRPRLVMVTSALPKEGKSVFAAEMARNAAAAGWRVLLLECDFGCPSLAEQFGLRQGPGLCEILSGGSLGDTDRLIHKPEPRLHVITAGKSSRDSQELLASRRMSALLVAVRAQYDLVLLDTPPVLPVADALVLGRQVDAALAVVRWEKTSRAAAIDGVRLLRESGARVMGVVMTQVDLRTASISGGRMAYAFRDYDGYTTVRG